MGVRRLVAALLLLAALLGMAGTAWADYPEADEPTWGFDPIWDEITLIRADLDPGEVGWCVFYGTYNSDSWDHSLNVYVVNRSADGVIDAGGEVVVRNESSGYEGVMGVKPIPEWQDWPSYKNDNLTLFMRDSLGRKSDTVKLIKQIPRAGTTLPPEFNLFHLGRDIGIYECVGAAAEATPTATPELTATPSPTSTPVAGGTWAVIEQAAGRIVIERR